MIKASKFNMIYKLNGSRLIVLNNLYNKIVNIDEQTYEDLCSNKVDSENSSIFEYLTSYNFLIEDYIDESKINLQKFQESIESNEELELVIVLGHKCNYKCTYCWQENTDADNIGTDDVNKIMAFVEGNISNKEILVINWIGGEPLMYLKEIVELSNRFKSIAVKHDKEFVAGITTNGHLLDEKMTEILDECDVRFYTVTLDGTKVNHNKNRISLDGSDSYDTIENNIKKLCTNDNCNRVVNIRMNLNKEVIKQTKEISENFKFMGEYENVSITAMQTVDHKMGTKLISDDELIDFILSLRSQGLKVNLPFGLGFMNAVCSGIYRNHYKVKKGSSLYKCDETTVYFGLINSDGSYSFNNELFDHFRTPEKYCLDCKLLPLCQGMICPERKNTCQLMIAQNPNFGRLLEPMCLLL